MWAKHRRARCLIHFLNGACLCPDKPGRDLSTRIDLRKQRRVKGHLPDIVRRCLAGPRAGLEIGDKNA